MDPTVLIFADGGQSGGWVRRLEPEGCAKSDVASELLFPPNCRSTL
jgi:hypothetical protein